MRITRDEMFMGMAMLASLRGTCERKQVGAVITVNSRPISVGYVGSAPGTPHCTEVGCLIGPDGGCIRTQHAEANAIAWAARHGLPIGRSTLYTTLSPCLSCAKLIASAGVTKVVFDELYRDKSGVEYLQDAKINCVLFPFSRESGLPYVRPVPTRQDGVSYGPWSPKGDGDDSGGGPRAA